MRQRALSTTAATSLRTQSTIPRQRGRVPAPGFNPGSGQNIYWAFSLLIPPTSTEFFEPNLLLFPLSSPTPETGLFWKLLGRKDDICNGALRLKVAALMGL